VKTLALLLVSTRTSLILMRRYLADTITQVLWIYLVFLMIFLGYRLYEGGAPGGVDRTAALVIGFMVFGYSIAAFSHLAANVAQEALQGTLEQLAMSPLGLRRVLACRLVGFSLLSLLVVLVLLYLMMATTGRWLPLQLGSIVPLLLVTTLSVHGIGFAVAGLAIVFQRVGATLVLFRWPLIALAMAPADLHPALPWLPVAWGASLIRRCAVEHVGLGAFSASDLLILALNSLGWLALGLVFFSRMEARARREGLLGHY
jgi:ABC-2 type transport system permease protein